MSDKIIGSFPEPNNDNIGGGSTFRYIPSEEVAWIPPFPFFELKDYPVLVQDSNWRKGIATYKTLSFSEKLQENESGRYFLTEITGFYPKLTFEVLKLFGLMKKHTFIVDFTDNNGNRRLSGTVEEPLEFAFNQSTGNQPSYRNGWEFRFYGNHRYESPFFEPDTP